MTSSQKWALVTLATVGAALCIMTAAMVKIQHNIEALDRASATLDKTDYQLKARIAASKEMDDARARFIANPHLSETRRGRIAKKACEDSVRLTVDQCLLIADHHVWVGMTAVQAEMAWGRPQQINESDYGTGPREQWVYGIGDYLYIEDGRVSAIQGER